MESIFIKGTKRTPEIVFKINGFLSINGVSIPELPINFTNQPWIGWINMKN
jgi:hypothetical protein